MMNRRDGQVLVLGVAAIVVVGVVAMLTVDLGHAILERSVLQNAADAAAMAGTHKLVETRNAGAGEEEARTMAWVVAETFGAANADGARFDVAFGTYEDGHFVQFSDNDGEVDDDDFSSEATAVRVNAWIDQVAPGGSLALYFGPIVGLDTMDLSGTAIVALTKGIKTIRGDLMPITVWEEDVVAPGETMTIFPTEMIVPGNFGVLNLDGGPCSVNELAEWIRNGYPGEVTVDPEVGSLLVEGSPGIDVSLKDDLESRVGDIMFICIYDQVTGEGSSAEFRIVGFLAVTILEVNLTGGEKYVTARVELSVSVPDSETGGSDSNLCKVYLAY